MVRRGRIGAACIGCTGYTYDAFGRATALPGGGTVGHHANDLVATTDRTGDTVPQLTATIDGDVAPGCRWTPARPPPS
ncbi:hypothetical protein [Streptomyces sp. NPDC048737]|uniref:hypothetical protein n=1 Tax=unclassified Streptomyces TaxID=2593676 RepID=UPI00343EC2CA